jgi:hypothetical protein
VTSVTKGGRDDEIAQKIRIVETYTHWKTQIEDRHFLNWYDSTIFGRKMHFLNFSKITVLIKT